MTYVIEYFPLVVKKDIPSLGSAGKRIQNAIEKKLTKDPVRCGKPLQYELKVCRALRVGDHRVVFLIRSQSVLIVNIDHRSKVYESAIKRIFNAV